MNRAVLKVAGIVVLGLVFAAGLGLAAHLVTRDTVGLSGQPLAVPKPLAPPEARRDATAATTTAGTTTTRTTTTRTQTDAETETDDSGRGRGRGRGRGGDDDNSGSGSGNSGSGGGGDD